MNLTIKPLSCDHVTARGNIPAPEQCGDRVTIFNKMRERFEIQMQFAMKLENITIDSADSVLPFGSPCLSEYRQCCKHVPDLGIVNFSPKFNDSCASNFTAL